MFNPGVEDAARELSLMNPANMRDLFALGE